MQPTAASAVTISGADVNAQPFARPGEALEVVPGLIVTQHSGEGKANQYFLRGFNLDHGTDLAIRVDGMPVNMPTHGHGQGYADINFMIPELIQSVNVRKGPYFADVGDFGSAGSVAIDYINRLPKNILETTNGTFGYHRGLAAGSHVRRCGHAARGGRGRQIQRPVGRAGQCAQAERRAALQPGHGHRRLHAVGDGLLQCLEFDRPGGAARDRPGHHRPLRLARSDRWRRLEPLLAVEQFCAVERIRADQGQRLRRQLGAAALQQFHLFPRRSRQRRPVQPDGPAHGLRPQRQPRLRRARRPASRRRPASALQTRGDDIRVGLFKTLQRETLSTVREDSVREGNVGLWADTTARWTDWLRTTVGIREDYFAGRVTSDTPQNSGNAQASMTSPKAGIVLGPWYKTEFYGNAGYGLHSNDISGATITVDPIDKVTPQDRVPLLVRSKGAEIGVRTRAIEGLTSSLARVRARLRLRAVVRRRCRHHRGRAVRAGASAWNGPTSTRCCRGCGSISMSPTPGPASPISIRPATFIPGAPAWVVSGGVTFGDETGWFGALRGRYFGPRPLIEDDSVRSQSSLIFNARAGYRFDNGLQLQLDVLNLFNAKTNQIEYYYLSRLPGEPIDGVRGPACASGRTAGRAPDAGRKVLGISVARMERSDIREIRCVAPDVASLIRATSRATPSRSRFVARLQAALRRADRDVFDGEIMFRHGDAFDHRRLNGHFL